MFIKRLKKGDEVKACEISKIFYLCAVEASQVKEFLSNSQNYLFAAFNDEEPVNWIDLLALNNIEFYPTNIKKKLINMFNEHFIYKEGVYNE